MKRFFPSLLIGLMYSQWTYAGLIQYFKDEEGRTNWQYVANFSSSMLILILTFVVIRLYFIDRRLRRTNRALQDIRDALEVRVQERTATLNESNRLLRETNNLLEKEIGQHQQTTSKLKRSEAYIKNILESMPLMLIGISGDGVVTQWNRKAEEITGLTPDQALNQNLWQAYPAITVSQRQIDQAIQQNKPVTIKHSQRDSYHFDIIIYPLQGDDETNAVILIDDVTQRIQAENMLIQRDKMSAMGELASTMAYDINAPLQAILSDVSNIQAFLANSAINNPDEETQSQLNKLNELLVDASEKGSNASAIIHNLLNFSRAQSNEKQKADVVATMENAITLANDVISVPGKLSFRQITIERDYDEGLSPLACYPAELQQVFLNLFRHSCHALSAVADPEHKPVIRVQIVENLEALWIKIQHNGVGLSLDEQKYIFEPFFNNPSDLDDPSKRLSFSYFIITEHHKGNMAVTSDTETGSTFHIQFHLD